MGQVLFKLAEVSRQRVDTQRLFEVACIALGEVLDQMLQVDQPVIDGSGGEHEHLLSLGQVLHLPVAGCVLFCARVAKVVRLIHHNHVGLVFDALKAFDPFTATLQIGVIDDHQVGKDAKQLRQIRAQRRFPNRLAPRFRNDEQHLLALKLYKAFNQHQTHEGLAKAHAIAQKRTAKLTAYFQQCAVAISLVLVEDGVHPRVVALPITGCLFVVAEILLQRFGVHLKWQVFTGVPFDDLEHIGRNVFGLIPMRLVPLLQFFDLSAQLHVQFNVAGQPRKREIAGANQRRRAHHRQLGVGDVCLGVEFLFCVNPALDFSAGDGLHDGRNT